jgi:ABC-type multidrug transport system fused ATPase/permease subunit
MVAQSPTLTVCCVGGVAAMALLLALLGERVRTRAAAAQAAQAALAGHATDALQAMPVVISHDAARGEAAALAALARDASDARIRQVMKAQRTRLSVTLHPGLSEVAFWTHALCFRDGAVCSVGVDGQGAEEA